MADQHKKIDIAASGTIAAAGSTTEIIRVLDYTIVAAGTVTAKWVSGTTDLTGAMSMVVGQPITPSPHGGGFREVRCLLETAAGEDLKLTLSAGVQVSGHCTIERVGT